MHLSMRPELHALARAWVSAAEDTASRKAVSLKAGGERRLKVSIKTITLHWSFPIQKDSD